MHKVPTLGGRPKQTQSPEWSQMSTARVGNHRETRCGRERPHSKKGHRLREPCRGCGWHRARGPRESGRATANQGLMARAMVGTVPAEETEGPAHSWSWEPLIGGCELSGLPRWVAAEFQEQGCGSSGRTSGAGCPRADASQTDPRMQMLSPGEGKLTAHSSEGTEGLHLSPFDLYYSPPDQPP